MKFQSIRYLATFCLLFLASGILTSQNKQSNASTGLKKLQSTIDEIVTTDELSSSLVGIKVVSLEDGKTLYDRNSNKLFHPASNTKLLTTAAALAKLPRYVFKTKLYSDSKINDSTLRGNLYIKGSGDPLLLSRDLDSLAAMIKNRGIRTIKGDLIGDISAFDTVAWGTGWMWDDEPSSDEPFITPLSVDSNVIHLTIAPGAGDGRPAVYTAEPVTDDIDISNNVQTRNDTIGFALHPSRLRGTNQFTLEGRIAPGAKTYHNELSVWKPELFFLHLFRDKLSKHGVRIKGNCRFDILTAKTLLGEIDHSIDSVIIRTNKQSYNLGAEVLLKTLGSEFKGAPGTSANGATVVKEYLSKLGIDTTNMIMMDGSGVSFYDLFTPGDMIRLLRAEYKSKTAFGTYYASLPIAGIDGTLKNRMKGTKAEGNVRAKTGSLTGESALSGYVTTADSKLLAFSIMCNHFPGEGRVLRDLQNRILELLAEYKGLE